MVSLVLVRQKSAVKPGEDAFQKIVELEDATFEEMLGHRSGFADSAKTWTALRNEISAGLDYAREAQCPGDSKGSTYANWNFCMPRLLIPYLMKERQLGMFTIKGSDETTYYDTKADSG